MYYYDSDFYRQRHQERMAETRREYQCAQAWRESRAHAGYAQSAWSRMRWAFPRRAPVFRP